MESDTRRLDMCVHVNKGDSSLLKPPSISIIHRFALMLAQDATVDDLKQAMHKHTPKLYTSRQRFTLPPDGSAAKPVVLEAGKPLSDYDLKVGHIMPGAEKTSEKRKRGGYL